MGPSSDSSVIPKAPYGPGHGLPSPEQFRDAVQARLVSRKTLRTRSGLTYHLFNYTPRAVYGRAWSDVTMAARGLILCEETGEVVAAPFSKFMNLGEPLGDGTVADVRNGPFDAFIKLDGSLGILYRADDEVHWATRGSFDSPQSRVAEAMWRARYHQHDRLLLDDPAWVRLTLLAEIVHPDTRVVCRYDFADLVLLGARNRFSGEDLAYDRLAEIADRLGMPLVERVDGDIEALLRRAETLDDNQEGFVLRWADGYRLKVKGAAYKQLHRVLSNLTPQRIAQEWREGRLEDAMLLMPEEFRDEAEAVRAELDGLLHASVREVGALYARAPKDGDRRAFAEWVGQNVPRPLHGLLYARRQLDLADAAAVARLVRGVVADLARAGRLADLVSDAALGDELRRAEAALADHLWRGTRDRAALNQLRGWANRLPRALRGGALGAADDLLPESVVAKLRAFVDRPDVREQVGELDVEALVASAPSADAPLEQHRAWVLAQPLVLRSLLDRWRLAGQPETASEGARKLLALGLMTETLGLLLADVSSETVDVSGIERGLGRLEAELARLWDALPKSDDPGEMLAGLDRLDAAERPWARALVQEYWAAHRERALAQFLEAHAGDQGRAARLADDA